jgi:hypothetical protein
MALATRVIAPSAALGAITRPHPLLHVSGEERSAAPGKRVPFTTWGSIGFNNATLGSLECLNVFVGDGWNETEPEGVTENALR